MRTLVVAIALATTWYVKPGGSGAGTQANPFGTVQQGVDAAVSGDTVVLEPGVYMENVAVAKDGIILMAQDAGTAVINGQAGAAAQKPALLIRGGNWQILGLTLVDGGVENLYVTGSSCSQDAGLLIQGLVTGGTVPPPARSCTALPDAGDVHSHDVRVECLAGPVTIEGSTFAARACTESLLVSAVGPKLLVQGNDISGAHVIGVTLDQLDGGEIRRNFVHTPCCDGFTANTRADSFGVHVTSSTHVIVHHNLVVGTGRFGIGAFDSKNVLSNESVVISDNTLVGEECGVRYNAVSGTAHSNLIVEAACTDAGCTNPCGKACGVDIVNTEGGTAETVSVGYDLFNPEGAGTSYCVANSQNMMTAGPVTTAVALLVNASAGNFRLTAQSPAVDRGDPATPAGVDFDGNIVPAAGAACASARADIGCFEYQLPQGTTCDAGTDAGRDGGGVPDSGEPLAIISPVSQSIDAGAVAVLDGSQSRASPGATLTSYEWTQTQGPSGLRFATGPAQTFTFPSPGSYVFQLVVKDSTGQLSAPATATVTVAGDTGPPAYQPGCGCSGSAAAPLLVLAALLMGRRRASRRAA